MRHVSQVLIKNRYRNAHWSTIQHAPQIFPVQHAPAEIWQAQMELEAEKTTAI
jgi:hypothetical protein